MLQIGAIYLWSYVYNIVRVSSSRSSKEVEIIDSPVNKPSRENLSSPTGSSSTEPLLSSSYLIEAEDSENGLTLPQDRLECKPQVCCSLISIFTIKI